MASTSFALRRLRASLRRGLCRCKGVGTGACDTLAGQKRHYWATRWPRMPHENGPFTDEAVQPSDAFGIGLDCSAATPKAASTMLAKRRWHSQDGRVAVTVGRVGARLLCRRYMQYAREGDGIHLFYANPHMPLTLSRDGIL